MDLERIIKTESTLTPDLTSLQKLHRTLHRYRTQLPELQRLQRLIEELPTPGRNNLYTEALMAIMALLSQFQSESEVYRKLFRDIKDELFYLPDKGMHRDIDSTWLTEEYVREVLYTRQHPMRSKINKWFGKVRH